MALPAHRRADIQGLRAIAVAAVIAFHAGLPLPGGFVGVDVFFVISGFVITAMLQREQEAKGSIDYARFYWRRFKRLTPALAVVVTVTLVLSTLALSPLGSQQVAAQTGIGALLITANYVIAATTGGYFAPRAESNPLLHTWSLSVEEQFYLVFPALLGLGWWIMRRSPTRVNTAALLVALIGMGSAALVLAGALGIALPGVSVPPSFYSPFSRAWEFAAGALLAFVNTQALLRRRGLASALGVIGAGLLLASLVGISAETMFPGPATLVPVIATAFLLLAGRDQGNAVSRMLATRPMVRVGDWSYSLYLWHWPIIVLAAAVWPRQPGIALIAACVSVAPALVSYYRIEQPLRRMTFASRRRGGQLIVLTVATPIVTAVALIFSANHGFWIDRLKQFEARDVPRLGAVAQCNDPTWNPALDTARCQFNVEQPGRMVYLIGDSYAEVLGDPLAEAARREGRPFRMKSYGGCPAVLSHVGSWPTRTENSPNCSLVVRESLDWLSESPPGTVVIANAEYYVRDPNIDMWRGSSITAQRATDKVTAFTAGLSAVVDELRKTGHDIIVVQPIPNFRLDTDRVTQERWNGVTECATIRVLTNTCLTSAPESLAEITKRQSGLRNAISGLATRESLTIVDVRDHLCASGLCAVQQGDTLMFREYLHLTVDGAKTLTPFMIEALRASDELRG